MVGAEEEQQLQTGAPDSPSSWSLGQMTLLRTKKRRKQTGLVNKCAGELL